IFNRDTVFPQGKPADAAEALKMTAKDLLRLGIIERIIPEPQGGAHRDPQKMAEIISMTIGKQLANLETIPPDERLRQRYSRLRKIGAYTDSSA
ncbi:MAG: hypothetical protein ACE5J1_05675, partial [Nitrospiria bacterium]